MNILVAGGAGYIGSHVCKLLKKKGYNPVVIDNLSHGYEDFAVFGDFLNGDIADSDLLDKVFNKYKIGAVMHFCAFIEVGESVTDPAKYYINNVANTINLIEAMRRHGVDKFIFSSTAAVYGVPEKTPILEDDFKSPINPYGKTKYFVENILDDYSSAYGFKSIRFRYFNASGASFDGEIGEAHIPETHLIPLILQAASGKRADIKVFGTDYPTPDGTAVRDYVHVDDLAAAHLLGLERLLNGGGTDYFNLGSGKGYSVREVIDAAVRVTGKKITVVETDRRAGDPPFLVASSVKAEKLLGWKPVHALDDIIKSAWEWALILEKKSLK